MGIWTLNNVFVNKQGYKVMPLLHVSLGDFYRQVWLYALIHFPNCICTYVTDVHGCTYGNLYSIFSICASGSVIFLY